MVKPWSGLYHEEVSSWLLLSKWNHADSVLIWKILSRGISSRIGVPYRFILFDTRYERDMFDNGVSSWAVAISSLFINI